MWFNSRLSVDSIERLYCFIFTLLCSYSHVFFLLFICHSSEPSSSFDAGDTSGFDDGLRRRNIPSFDAPRPRTSDEEDEEDEVEFKLAEKKEEKSWFSLNKCIAGALILLFLGSLFLSGNFSGTVNFPRLFMASGAVFFLLFLNVSFYSWIPFICSWLQKADF